MKTFECIDCTRKSKRTIDEEKLIGKKHNKLTIINIFREKRKTQNGSVVFADCLCECGNIRKKIQLSKLNDGTVYSCRKCAKSISAMENFILSILENNNVEFEFQKHFSSCRDVFELPFDFYLPKFNTLIEYDGSQHYEQNHFYNNTDDFEKIKIHDEMKTKFAIENNIKLIRFNYKQKKPVIEKQLLLIIGCENRKKLLA